MDRAQPVPDLKRMRTGPMRIAAHRKGGIAGVLAQWGPLVLCLAAAFVAGQRVPRWGYMWLLAGALVAGMKWATVHAHGAVHPSYMWLWPGMDAGRFHEAPERSPAVREGLAACTRVLAGALLVWAVAPRLHGGLATAWAGLIGLGLVVHFGLLHLLSVVLVVTMRLWEVPQVKVRHASRLMDWGCSGQGGVCRP